MSTQAYRKLTLKWIAGFLPYASQSFEKRESHDLANYSAKIRAMLQEHLKATGIDDTCKIRHITDPEFWEDFHTHESARDLERAPIRKATELKKITREYANRNPKRYGKFSDRVIEIITRLEQAQIQSAAALLEFEQVAKDLEAETHAHRESGLSERAYDFYRILEAFPLEAEVVDTGALKYLAQQIHVLYLSDETAPISWQTGEEARKRLRQAVRALIVSVGFREWKEIPVQIEEYAVSNYAKL